MIPTMSPPVAIAFGVFLIILGGSFFYKGCIATVNGRVYYWAGFLPFTLASPFIMHLPAGKNSLVKFTEGLWVHALMAPIFFVCAIFCFIAGSEYVGLPGVKFVNLAFSGFKEGRPPSVIFDKRTGFKFPIVARTLPTIQKILGQEVGLSQADKLPGMKEDQGTLDQAVHQN